MQAIKITVFEYDTLYIDGQNFKQSHFNALVKFNDKHGSKYFHVGYEKIIFKSYVGVIQVGNRIIEVLPKADNTFEKDNNSHNKWQDALISMLKAIGFIKTERLDKSSQGSSAKSLLDIYLYSFLENLEILTKLGLIKKYRKVSSNSIVMKGRLLVNKQVQYNYIHKERFYTEYTLYNTNNPLNQILKRAIIIIIDNCVNAHLQNGFRKLLMQFEDIDVWYGKQNELDHIILDRKTIAYEEALLFSKLIIKNYSLNFSAGQDSVFALLFNMNVIFEKYVLKCMKDFRDEFKDYNLFVSGQESKFFWDNKKLRPDIVLHYRIGGIEKKIIIDTKWKVLNENGEPSDSDLKQMFTYNVQFGSTRAMLFYPKTNQLNQGFKDFGPSEHNFVLEHGCALHFADLFEGDKISNNFARDFLKDIIST
jgi:5-methylcytosine-specific restriction enzyme subunit McrC